MASCAAVAHHKLPDAWATFVSAQAVGWRCRAVAQRLDQASPCTGGALVMLVWGGTSGCAGSACASEALRRNCALAGGRPGLVWVWALHLVDNLPFALTLESPHSCVFRKLVQRRSSATFHSRRRAL